MTEADIVAHPLFLPAEDEDEDAIPPDVQEIAVLRKENGRMVTAPRTFYPNELTSVAQLHAEYGGGEYHLVSRNHKKQITARRLYTLPGPSKPLFDDGIIPGAATKPAQSPANPMAAVLGASAQGEGGIMALIMMMMQQMMQSNAAAQAQQTQMFIAMMQNNASATQADKQAQQEAYNRQRDQDRQHQETMMSMVKELASAKASGGDDSSFFKGVEFMRSFTQNQIETAKASLKGGETDGEALLNTLGEVITGGLQLYQLSQQGTTPGQVPEVPAPSVQ